MISKDEIYGLVLVGGKSTRMGIDKGLIEYHGQYHREYLYQILKKVCEKVYFSIRSDQEDDFSKKNIVFDVEGMKGPLAGMISAHHLHPNLPWLVLACDLPLIDTESVKKLIKERDSSKQSTAYAVNSDSLPEPLCAIWEPSGLKIAADYSLTKNINCPRKVLMNCDVKLVFPENEHLLLNANSQEEFLFAKTKIQKDEV